jgi:alpha-beta hydrolase superfamily lysophospholipase
VCIVHGLGEHGGRYVRLAPHIARQGYHVSAIDLQGHGQSPGKRGTIVSYDSLLDEVRFGLRWARQNYADLPCYLFGHSMGGNLVANYALRRSELPDAAIVSSPMFLSSREPKGLMNTVARIAMRIAPNLTLAAGTETKQLMDDPQEQQILDNDPLFHRRVSLRLGAALIDSGKWAIANAHSLSIPMLVSHGLRDRITLPEGSQQFASRAGERCRLKLLEEHLHESFRDQRRHEVIQLYVDFLNSLSP